MGRKLLILNERDLGHPWAGGAEVNVMEIARRAAAEGYRPTLLCTRFPGAAVEETRDGVRIRRVGNRLTYYLWLPWLVRRELAEPGTVIVEHLNKVPFCTALYARGPMVSVTHHLFGRTAFYQVPFPIAAMVVASERLIPFLYRRGPVVAVSPSTRDDLIKRGVPAHHIVVIPNGVDHSRYVPPARAATVPTVLIVGRIEPYKRIDLVLRAMPQVILQVPEARLVVVGTGQALGALQQLSRDLRVSEHVAFTGFVEETTKVRCIQQAAVVVSTSEKEGWGLTILEANACGVPAVVSDVPGLRDAVVPGETGLLVPHGDIEQLAAALVRLLRSDAERQRLAQGARAWSLKFSWARSTQEVLELIEATYEGSRWTEIIPYLGPWAPLQRVPASVPDVRSAIG